MLILDFSSRVRQDKAWKLDECGQIIWVLTADYALWSNIKA